jgi:hypothetical protein
MTLWTKPGGPSVLALLAICAVTAPARTRIGQGRRILREYCRDRIPKRGMPFGGRTDAPSGSCAWISVGSKCRKGPKYHANLLHGTPHEERTRPAIKVPGMYHPRRAAGSRGRVTGFLALRRRSDPPRERYGLPFGGDELSGWGPRWLKPHKSAPITGGHPGAAIRQCREGSTCFQEDRAGEPKRSV